MTFAYNPASQITQTVRTGDAYAYTAMGNGSTAFTQNGLNQQVSVGGSTAAWDSKGNLTTEPQTAKTYAYDIENKLLSSSGGTSTALSYDPLNRLDTYNPGTARRFIHDGIEQAAELDSSGNIVSRFVRGDGPDQLIAWYDGSGLTSRRFAGLDERGSVISATDSAGGLVAINAYDEYGKPAASNVGRFQYTGQMWLPEANVYYYKARAYLPHLGIFAQTDPTRLSSGMNLYAYAANSPINLSDPLGTYTGSNLPGRSGIGAGGCLGNCTDPLVSGEAGRNTNALNRLNDPSTQSTELVCIQYCSRAVGAAGEILVQPNPVYELVSRTSVEIVSNQITDYSGQGAFLQWWWDNVKGGAQTYVPKVDFCPKPVDWGRVLERGIDSAAGGSAASTAIRATKDAVRGLARGPSGAAAAIGTDLLAGVATGMAGAGRSYINQACL